MNTTRKIRKGRLLAGAAVTVATAALTFGAALPANAGTGVSGQWCDGPQAHCGCGWIPLWRPRHDRRALEFSPVSTVVTAAGSNLMRSAIGSTVVPPHCPQACLFASRCVHWPERVHRRLVPVVLHPLPGGTNDDGTQQSKFAKATQFTAAEGLDPNEPPSPLALFVVSTGAGFG